MSQDELEKRTVTIEKELDAPLTLTWDAWTKPEHIANWWAPNGMKMDIETHEFKVGGKWRFSMMMPDGNEFISEGVYQEIVEYEKIVTTADFKPMTEGVELHIFFESVGEKTKFTFKVVHSTEDYRKQQEQMGIYNGWGSAFERLEQFLRS